MSAGEKLIDLAAKVEAETGRAPTAAYVYGGSADELRAATYALSHTASGGSAQRWSFYGTELNPPSPAGRTPFIVQYRVKAEEFVTQRMHGGEDQRIQFLLDGLVDKIVGTLSPRVQWSQDTGTGDVLLSIAGTVEVRESPYGTTITMELPK